MHMYACMLQRLLDEADLHITSAHIHASCWWMHCPCIVHVLSMISVCIVYVLCMYSACIVHVLCIYCVCIVLVYAFTDMETYWKTRCCSSDIEGAGAAQGGNPKEVLRMVGLAIHATACGGRRGSRTGTCPTYIHTCIHAYIHTHIRTYIHTYMHTYIHACIYSSKAILIGSQIISMHHNLTIDVSLRTFVCIKVPFRSWRWAGLRNPYPWGR